MFCIMYILRTEYYIRILDYAVPASNVPVLCSSFRNAYKWLWPPSLVGLYAFGLDSKPMFPFGLGETA